MKTQEIIDGMDAQQKQLLLMGVTCACNMMDLYSAIIAGHQVYHFKKELEEKGFKVEIIKEDKDAHSK